jgi:hypothetical protein
LKQQISFIYKAKQLSAFSGEASFRNAMHFYKAALFRETAFHEPARNRAADAWKSCIAHASDAE